MRKSISLGGKVRTVFLGWRLKHAVRQENVNSVQRWATPELFDNMSEKMNDAIMEVACTKASQMKPTHNSERILDHLLHNGGVLSKQCLQKKWDGEPSLGILGFKWMQMAVDCNAVHDNLKYLMLRQGIHNHKHNALQYGHELSESIVAKWPEYFIQKQKSIPESDRDYLWKCITEKGSDTLLRQFVEITPKNYIKIDYLKYLHKRDDYPSPLSVKTLEALHHKGFGVDSLMHLWITGNEISNMTKRELESYLDRNPTLVKNINQWEMISMEQQRQRLLDETDKVSSAEHANVKPRKM